MATLDSLKRALRQKASARPSLMRQRLTDLQYDAGFDIVVGRSGQLAYYPFVFPQLSQLLAGHFGFGVDISVLEIGPGSESVLGGLPRGLRQKVKRYVAYEPNDVFASRLGTCLRSSSESESLLPNLESPADIRCTAFVLDSDTTALSHRSNDTGSFNLILFCHSMYGMRPKDKFIKKALEMLVEKPERGLLVVFHRGDTLQLEGLTCHRTACFPTGTVSVEDEDETLDHFAPFIAGFGVRSEDTDGVLEAEWREVCRALGRRQKSKPGELQFRSPEVMAAFTKDAASAAKLAAQVPVIVEGAMVKSSEARLQHPSLRVRPTNIRQVQRCVQWALDHECSLTIIGGGHSGQCLRNNVVSVDMSAFDQIHHVTSAEEGLTHDLSSDAFIVVEAGCKSGDIVHKTIAAGLTVPLGSRPSVGSGLWLQGGIGHLARLHGLSCDAVVGAVLVSVADGQVIYVGHVPSQHRPVDAVRPWNEVDLLWAIKGAGTNFGIVISATFKAYTAPTYSVWTWILPLSHDQEMRVRLSQLDESIAAQLPRDCSVDAYLYRDVDKLCLGVTVFRCTMSGFGDGRPTATPKPLHTILGQEESFKTVDGVGLSETEMYVSKMHGGHGTGKTSSFKRCLFLKRIGSVEITMILARAIEDRPSPLCYLHLLQGGGAVGDVADDATAFGCRDWDFACVITGVWPREQDGTEVNRATIDWVYSIAMELLPLSSGAYGADLGPDPRDASLAAKAFGPNLPRLGRVKRDADPNNVLAYACPLAPVRKRPQLVVLVTGESCAGKDHCADIWVSVFARCSYRLTARTVSISLWAKIEYAAASGANMARLLRDRAYKERHRANMSRFFLHELRLRPRLREEHFKRALSSAADVDVLLITGMRDEAPVAALSHLIPDCRLLEVRIETRKETRDARRRCPDGEDIVIDRSNYLPSFVFDNDTDGDEAAKLFCQDHLLPFFHEDLDRLANMVRSIPDFPRPGIEFRHVLGIAQHPGGLTLCTSLMQRHFAEDWKIVDALVCCEAGGFIFASALSAQLGVPLALIREAGKLPPPTISAAKAASYVSSSSCEAPSISKIEMGLDAIPRDASVVVVDDVLATGETLCAVLQLLQEAGINAENVKIMVVAEFPLHRGRELLGQRGFGRAQLQSLLIFGGA